VPLYCFNYRSKFAHLVSSIAVAALYERRLPSYWAVIPPSLGFGAKGGPSLQFIS
jgi:hypothetical protein